MQKDVGSNLVSSNIQDGNGVKAMPGSILAPNSVADPIKLFFFTNEEFLC